LPDVAENVELNQTHADDKSVAPLVSEYCNENVCVVPEPEPGDEETALTTRGAL
jgi:hypothetical protein